MENKIFEIMLKNSNIVDLGDEGEMPVINVEQFRDIAKEIVKKYSVPDVSSRRELLEDFFKWGNNTGRLCNSSEPLINMYLDQSSNGD